MRSLVLGFVAAACPVGCAEPKPPSAPAGPLTVDQWKALPVETKYEIDTLERLRQGDPKLRDQREWDTFTRDILLPARKKDRLEQKGK